MGHALMENRNGLDVDACLTEANGHAERIAALHMIEPRADRPRPIRLGADKGYDAEAPDRKYRSPVRPMCLGVSPRSPRTGSLGMSCSRPNRRFLLPTIPWEWKQPRVRRHSR
jgi:hypothetical protein